MTTRGQPQRTVTLRMPEETLQEAMNQPPSLTFSQQRDQIESISQLRTEMSTFIDRVHTGVGERPGMFANGQKVTKTEVFPVYGNKGNLSVSINVHYKEKKK